MTRHRKVLLSAVLAAVALPFGFVAFAAFHFRHVPYRIAERDRAPAFDPAAAAKGGLTLRYLGVSGYEVSDGKTTLLLDPTPTRPTVVDLLRPLRPDEALGARLCPRADFILVNHAHFDHILDVPAIALRTGAAVVGSRSAVNLALSRGVPEDRTREAAPGAHFTLGTFTVDVRGSRHSALPWSSNPMAGTIPRDARDLYYHEFRQDAVLSYRLEAAGTTIWFHPSSTYAPGELGGLPARTLILGVSGEPVSVEKIRGLLDEAKPARVIPTHYDNFLQPIERGLALLPEAELSQAREAVLNSAAGVSWWMMDYDQKVAIPPDPR